MSDMTGAMFELQQKLIHTQEQLLRAIAVLNAHGLTLDSVPGQSHSSGLHSRLDTPASPSVRAFVSSGRAGTFSPVGFRNAAVLKPETPRTSPEAPQGSRDAEILRTDDTSMKENERSRDRSSVSVAEKIVTDPSDEQNHSTREPQFSGDATPIQEPAVDFTPIPEEPPKVTQEDVVVPSSEQETTTQGRSKDQKDSEVQKNHDVPMETDIPPGSTLDPPKEPTEKDELASTSAQAKATKPLPSLSSPEKGKSKAVESSAPRREKEAGTSRTSRIPNADDLPLHTVGNKPAKDVSPIRPSTTTRKAAPVAKPPPFPRKKAGPPGLPATSVTLPVATSQKRSRAQRSDTKAGPALKKRKRIDSPEAEQPKVKEASSTKVVPPPSDEFPVSNMRADSSSAVPTARPWTILGRFRTPGQIPYDKGEKGPERKASNPPRSPKKTSANNGEEQEDLLRGPHFDGEGSSSSTLVHESPHRSILRSPKQIEENGNDDSDTPLRLVLKKKPIPKRVAFEPYVLLKRADPNWKVIDVDSISKVPVHSTDGSPTTKVTAEPSVLPILDVFDGDCPELTDSSDEDEDTSEVDQLLSESEATEGPHIATLPEASGSGVPILMANKRSTIQSSTRPLAGPSNTPAVSPENTSPPKTSRPPSSKPRIAPRKPITKVGPPKSPPKNKTEDDKEAPSRTKRVYKQRDTTRLPFQEELVQKRLTYYPDSVFDDSDIFNVGVTRPYINKTFGAPTKFDVYWQSTKAFHDFGAGTNFMFVTEKEFPEAPSKPGQSGLLCTISDDLGWLTKAGTAKTSTDRIYFKMFYLRHHYRRWTDAQIQHSKAYSSSQVWLYLGDYYIIPSKGLQPEEFRELHPDVKHSWAKKVRENPNNIGMYARITFRDRYHRNPSRVDVENQIAEMRSRRERSPGVTEDVIIKAFEDGTETISIFALKSDSYDRIFQERLIEGFEKFGPESESTTKTQRRTSKCQPKSVSREQSPDIESEDDAA